MQFSCIINDALYLKEDEVLNVYTNWAGEARRIWRIHAFVCVGESYLKCLRSVRSEAMQLLFPVL